MNCPRCDSPTKTLETRRVPDGAVRRRRECPSCGHRFTTYERAVPEALEVIKRDGRRQPFDRDKLLRSLDGATHKRTSIRASSASSSTVSNARSGTPAAS